MKTKQILCLLLLCFIGNIYVFAQEIKSIVDSSYLLNEVTISANKVEQKKRNVAQQIEVLTAKQIASSQAQTTADLLANTGLLTIQKSQQGGGSPVLRGFEANRIVMMVDGVRMNNIIYRGGHLQNVITLDNAILDRAEILFGPASTIYGSDALGGAICFYTKKPRLAYGDKKTNIGVNAFYRYGDVNNESAGHVDFNIGGSKLAALTSFTFSQFGDLRSGTNQNPFYKKSYGERPYFVERINGKDSLVENEDRFVQKKSAYSQYDFLEKILFQQNEYLSHQLNFQYSGSSDIPRYDRLTDPAGNGLRFADWHYGPQQRLLAAYDLSNRNDANFFQSKHMNVSYQTIEESRVTRRFNNNYQDSRVENVAVVGANMDVQRTAGKHEIRIGADFQYNNLKSTASRKDIVADTLGRLDTRYPDGTNSMSNMGVYVSHTWQMSDKLILNAALRGGMTSLQSSFEDTTFFPLPFKNASQVNPVYSGSIGLINTPSDDFKLSLLLSTGFRAPNVDDLSKVFESTAGSVIVPNSDLKPERTVSTELGITKYIGTSSMWQNTFYYTQFLDAIVTDEFKYNGKDSIFYNGTLSRVLANQNKRKAYIYGFSSIYHQLLSDNLILDASLTYTYGRIKTDSSDAPLDHISPLIAHIGLKYEINKFNADFFINYNGWKKIKDYYLNGEDNEQYATADGMPAWFTANLRVSYKVWKYITLQAGVDNILDTQYRTFSSGINAPGRNVFAALRFNY